MTDVRTIWDDLSAGLAGAAEVLAATLASVWKSAERITAVPAGQEQDVPGQRGSLEDLFGPNADRLLHAPVAAWQAAHPQDRAIAAFEDYSAAVAQLVLNVPVTVVASGAELIEVLDGIGHAPFWRRYPLQWSKQAQSIPLRQAAEAFLVEDQLRRSRLDTEFLDLLTAASKRLIEPWREHRDAWLTDSPEEPGSDSGDLADLSRRFEASSQGYLQWQSAAVPGLARSLLVRAAPRADRTVELASRRQDLSRRARSLGAVLDMEVSLAKTGRLLAVELAAAQQACRVERDAIVSEMDAFVAWIDSSGSPPNTNQLARPPQPRAALLPAAERTGKLMAEAEGAGRKVLSASIETIAPRLVRRSLLRRHAVRYRRVEPFRQFRLALEEFAEPSFRAAFDDVEAGDRALSREIDRAREVLAFACEASEAGEPGVLEEAVRNARALLVHRRESLTREGPLTMLGLTAGGAAAMAACHAALEKDRLGLITYLAERRGSRALTEYRARLRPGLTRRSRLFWKHVREWIRRGLRWVGWLPPPRAYETPVVTQTDLEQTLRVQFGQRELPLLYQRLFRMAPVDDPRFLVGRRDEFSGLAAALERWRKGHNAAVLLVGARGSGKTSLLNCAERAQFANQDVVRFDLRERVTTPAEIRSLLRSQLGIASTGDLEAALAQRRPVIMIEELERSFLRRAGGFGALRELLRLVSATGTSAFWVLSLNEVAFAFLKAAVGIESRFSHRINAMAVPQEHLTGAILQRHNLTGLRLDFARPDRGSARTRRLRETLGLDRSPEDAFFDSLYEASEGIFRSAFGMWQACVDRVEGGAVHMRQPMRPQYDKVLGHLARSDFFTLAAIMQHGGLTGPELSEVLLEPLETSQERLDRLCGLDILEPEPHFPGFRVRPEGNNIIRIGLHRNNLT